MGAWPAGGLPDAAGLEEVGLGLGEDAASSWTHTGAGTGVGVGEVGRGEVGRGEVGGKAASLLTLTLGFSLPY